MEGFKYVSKIFMVSFVLFDIIPVLFLARTRFDRVLGSVTYNTSPSMHAVQAV